MGPETRAICDRLRALIDRTPLDQHKVIVVEAVKQLVQETERLMVSVRLETDGVEPVAPKKVACFEILGVRSTSTSGYYEACAAIGRNKFEPPLVVEIHCCAPKGVDIKPWRDGRHPMQAGIARALGLHIDSADIEWIADADVGPYSAVVTITEKR
ncbi:MAG: hypothetical protein ACHREM_00320 [Polyangiales bacterium]